MNLIIDIGNSFVKAAVFQRGKIIGMRKFSEADREKEIKEIFNSHSPIEKIIVSDVTGEALFLEKFKVPLLELGPSTKLPFKNLYKTPETLGKDRIALMAAAVQHFPKKNVLVIDAGTCLTFDIKNKRDEYLGGSISPGLKMRFEALNHFTAKLPLIAPATGVELTGNDTESSILSGVIMGMIKEIDGVIEEYKALYEDLTVILTGGDAQLLSIRLKNSIFANSNFLFEGLNYILEFNNNQ